MICVLGLQEEGKAELSVLLDRAQGGASLASGQVEVMLHRRTLFDDQRGVGEPLNETMQGLMNCPSVGLVARGRHWLSLQVCCPEQLLFDNCIAYRKLGCICCLFTCPA